MGSVAAGNFNYIMQSFQIGESFVNTIRPTKYRGKSAGDKFFRLVYNEQKKVYDKDVRLDFNEFRSLYKSMNKIK